MMKELEFHEAANIFPLHDCSQVILSEDDEVETPQRPEDVDKAGFVKLGRRRRAERERRAGRFA